MIFLFLTEEIRIVFFEILMKLIYKDDNFILDYLLFCLVIYVKRMK